MTVELGYAREGEEFGVGAKQPVQQGNVLEPVRVTRQEELMYGASYAPFLRKLADAAKALEQSGYQVGQLVKGAYEADSITQGQTNASLVLDGHGQSRETVWLQAVDARVTALNRLVSDTLQELGVESIERERMTRTPQEDTPRDNGPADFETGEVTEDALVDALIAHGWRPGEPWLIKAGPDVKDQALAVAEQVKVRGISIKVLNGVHGHDSWSVARELAEALRGVGD